MLILMCLPGVMVQPAGTAASGDISFRNTWPGLFLERAGGGGGRLCRDFFLSIWDLRTNQSLYTLVGESLKEPPAVAVGSSAQVYGVHSGELGVLSAGQDRCVRVFRAVD